MKLVLASNNKNKILEINNLIGDKYQIVSLQDVGIFEEIEEPFDTFEENALAKAQYVFDKTGIPTFSEDSGLLVNALNGAPGVFSARYAGAPKSDVRNTQLLLSNMEGIEDRSAYYQTVICLIGLEDKPIYFKGKCEGTLSTEIIGEGGFGYDPIFIPNGYDTTFGVLPMEVKQAISHRKKAVSQLIEYLK